MSSKILGTIISGVVSLWHHWAFLSHMIRGQNTTVATKRRACEQAFSSLATCYDGSHGHNRNFQGSPWWHNRMQLFVKKNMT